MALHPELRTAQRIINALKLHDETAQLRILEQVSANAPFPRPEPKTAAGRGNVAPNGDGDAD